MNDYGIEIDDGLYEIISEIRQAKCIIFDLDGTLVNTIDDLAGACDYLLKEQGIEPKWNLNDYKRFVGNGAKLLVSRAFEGKLSDAELEEQYAKFKVKYNEIKLNHACAYDGMIDIVNALKIKGYKLAVCTNKPNISAVEMVEIVYGKNTFDFILGAVDNVPKKPNPAMAQMILSKLSVNADECVWIGDSSVDIESAHNIGCRSVAVTWGFRSYESLLLAEPTLIADTPKDFLKIFNLSVDI